MFDTISNECKNKCSALCAYVMEMVKGRILLLLARSSIVFIFSFEFEIRVQR